jgi:serine protease Do
MKKIVLGLASLVCIQFANAQVAGSNNKEVVIEKKVNKTTGPKADSSMRVTVTINGDTTENIAVMVDGDKITINGEEVNAADPRLKKIKRENVKGLKIASKPFGLSPERNAYIFKKAPQANRAFLGVVTEKGEVGARIVEISENSPAAKAQLKVGDHITSVNEEKIKDPESLYAAIGKYKPNEVIHLVYTRGNKTMKVDIELDKNANADQAMTFSEAPLDERTLELLDNMGGQYKFSMPELPNMDQLMTRADKKAKLGISVEDLETGKGVKVTNVSEGSPAAKAGILKDDILTQLNDSDIPDVNFMKWQYYFPGQVLKMGIERKGEKRTIEIKIPKKINTADL